MSAGEEQQSSLPLEPAEALASIEKERMDLARREIINRDGLGKPPLDVLGTDTTEEALEVAERVIDSQREIRDAFRALLTSEAALIGHIARMAAEQGTLPPGLPTNILEIYGRLGPLDAMVQERPTMSLGLYLTLRTKLLQGIVTIQDQPTALAADEQHHDVPTTQEPQQSLPVPDTGPAEALAAQPPAIDVEELRTSMHLESLPPYQAKLLDTLLSGGFFSPSHTLSFSEAAPIIGYPADMLLGVRTPNMKSEGRRLGKKLAAYGLTVRVVLPDKSTNMTHAFYLDRIAGSTEPQA